MVFNSEGKLDLSYSVPVTDRVRGTIGTTVKATQGMGKAEWGAMPVSLQFDV